MKARKPKARSRSWKVQLESIELPMVPNFLRWPGGVASVGMFKESFLRELGQRWTIALVMHARKRRKSLAEQSGGSR